MIELTGYRPQTGAILLPGFDVRADEIPHMGKKTLGYVGERTVERELARAGYHVERAQRKEGDLRVIDSDGVMHRVEVKTARPDKQGRWSFCLRRRLARGICTDYTDSDYLILLAVRGIYAEVYVLPCAAVQQANIGFRQQRSKKYAPYRVDDLRLVRFA